MKPPKFRLKQLISSPLVERKVNRECSVSLHVQRLQLLTLRYTYIDHHLIDKRCVKKVRKIVTKLLPLVCADVMFKYDTTSPLTVTYCPTWKRSEFAIFLPSSSQEISGVGLPPAMHLMKTGLFGCRISSEKAWRMIGGSTGKKTACKLSLANEDR